MHDDDEARFPRISLWQFLGGVLLVPLRFYDKWYGGGWIDDLASAHGRHRRRTRSNLNEKQRATAPQDEGQD
jgi:hypothetical protein